MTNSNNDTDYIRPINGRMMYTDMNFGITHTFYLHLIYYLKKAIILTHAS